MRNQALCFTMEMHKNCFADVARPVGNSEWTPQPYGKLLGFEPHSDTKSRIAATVIAPILRNEEVTTNSGNFEPSALRSEA